MRDDTYLDANGTDDFVFAAMVHIYGLTLTK
jgi:hypothetical protein